MLDFMYIITVSKWIKNDYVKVYLLQTSSLHVEFDITIQVWITGVGSFLLKKT